MENKELPAAGWCTWPVRISLWPAARPARCIATRSSR
jgi:hypothetical protein